MTDKILVFTTCGSREEAERVARGIVEQRLAACASVAASQTSVYHWKGQVETAEEWQVTFKSRRDLFGRLEEAVRAIHSYEVPELVAAPLTAGSAAYLGWMDQELAQPAESSSEGIAAG